MTVIGVQGSSDLLTLTKYVTGAAINKHGESSGIISGTAIFAGIQGGTWAWKNRNNIRAGLQTLSTNMSANRAIMQNVAKEGSGIWNTLKNLWRGGTEIVSKGKLEALAKGTDAAAISAQQVLASGKDFTQGLKAIEGGGSILHSIGKGIKGNAWFAAISFGLGVATDVIPAFQLSTDKGFKQLGKTAVKTTAEVGGWAAGSALGAKAGAVAGACIGGPVGAAVGAIIGVVGGFLGSFLCSKAADKIVGPSEVEKAQQENAEAIARQAAASGNESISEVAQAAYDKLLQSAAANGGKLTEDDLIVKKSLENLIGQEIDIESDLAQMAASGNTPSATTSTQASAQTDTSTQGGQTQTSDGAQTSTATQSSSRQTTVSDLPSTSSAYSTMLPIQMPTMPYTSYSGVNPFATTNPFISYSGLFEYQQQDSARRIA